MDKKKSAQNVIVSLCSKSTLLLVAIWVRRYVIQYLGNDINGLNSLFLNLLDVLSIAELGVGEAITYSMYAPIVEKRTEQVSAIYNCIRKIYRIIALVVFLFGILMIPFLEFLTKDYENTNVNMHLCFGLMLISTCITYLYGPESALFTAHKKQYVVTAIFAGGRIFQYAMQIIALVLTRSFVYFLIARIIASVSQWALVRLLALREYREIMHTTYRIDRKTTKEIQSNVGAMFMHKIGAVLVSSTDSICISAFVGVLVLGKYANYTTIMTSMTGVLAMFFTPLTAVIGHMYVGADKKRFQGYFNFMHGFNMIIAMVFFLGYYAVIDSLVVILFGENLELARSTTMVITVNYFCWFTRKAALLFRDATGLFYQDRWKSMLEGLLNLVLSWIFARYWGVVGVLIATIITNLGICVIVEPYVLHKYVFKTSCKTYYIRHYTTIGLFVCALWCLDRCMVAMVNVWVQMVENGMRSIAISLAASCLIAVTNKDFLQFTKETLLKKKTSVKG